MMNPTISAPSWKDRQKSQFSKVQLPTMPWRSLKLLMPHRMRRRLRSKLRSRISPATSIASLQTSFSPKDTLRSLQSYRWSVYDFQYLLLAIIGIFSLCMIQSADPFGKTFVASALLLSLLLPITRQFFLPFLPIAAWLIFFYACQFVPSEYRPGVWVRVLPALENILYGANISNILSAHQSVVLDVLAWIPYGPLPLRSALCVLGYHVRLRTSRNSPSLCQNIRLHQFDSRLYSTCLPMLPSMVRKYLWSCAPQTTQSKAIQLDWLVSMLCSALISIPPVSTPRLSCLVLSHPLHAADSTLAALFMSHVFPKLKPLFVTYTLWMWWATMYLSHHYAVDLVCGGILAAVAFYFAKARFLPQVQPGKRFRWDYDYIERGSGSDEEGYDLAHFKGHMHADSDEWTVGSSSSVSSGSLSPTEDQHLWEGETLASISDIESGR